MIPRLAAADVETRATLYYFRCALDPFPPWETSVEWEINNLLYDFCFEQAAHLNARLLLFEEHGTIAAVAAHAEQPNRPWERQIAIVAVQADFRQPGLHLGREAVSSTLADCLTQGATSATWLVDPRNTPSHKMSSWVGGYVVYDPEMEDAAEWEPDAEVAHLVRYRFDFPLVSD